VLPALLRTKVARNRCDTSSNRSLNAHAQCTVIATRRRQRRQQCFSRQTLGASLSELGTAWNETAGVAGETPTSAVANGAPGCRPGLAALLDRQWPSRISAKAPIDAAACRRHVPVQRAAHGFVHLPVSFPPPMDVSLAVFALPSPSNLDRSYDADHWRKHAEDARHGSSYDIAPAKAGNALDRAGLRALGRSC
jgi:hypothetical protein